MADFMNKKNYDIETGRHGQLYPVMQESPQLRWGFIRKVYSILCMQLLLTFGVASAMFLVQSVRDFMDTRDGHFCLIGVMIVTIILCLMMSCFSTKHPWNYILLFLFTISMAILAGAACTQAKGEVVLMAAGLTLLVTVSLTVFTFFAAKQGYDFSFLAPFLFCALLLLMAFGLIRMFFPLGQVAEQAIACISALIFSGFIIYDTDNLIKRFDYDQYIAAAACLYVDIMNLFLSLLDLLNGD